MGTGRLIWSYSRHPCPSSGADLKVGEVGAELSAPPGKQDSGFLAEASALCRRACPRGPGCQGEQRRTLAVLPQSPLPASSDGRSGAMFAPPGGGAPEPAVPRNCGLREGTTFLVP